MRARTLSVDVPDDRRAGDLPLPPMGRWDDEEEEEALTTCAFCLMTSAGVRIAQDTVSATPEAQECRIGVGKGIDMGLVVDDDSGDRIRFIPS